MSACLYFITKDTNRVFNQIPENAFHKGRCAGSQIDSFTNSLRRLLNRPRDCLDLIVRVI